MADDEVSARDALETLVSALLNMPPLWLLNAATTINPADLPEELRDLFTIALEVGNEGPPARAKALKADGSENIRRLYDRRVRLDQAATTKIIKLVTQTEKHGANHEVGWINNNCQPSSTAGMRKSRVTWNEIHDLQQDIIHASSVRIYRDQSNGDDTRIESEAEPDHEYDFEGKTDESAPPNDPEVDEMVKRWERQDNERKADAHVNNGAAKKSEKPRPLRFADDSLALRFADRHVENLRYVAALGRWFEWDGARWKPDDTRHAFDWVRKVCREAASECDNKRIAPGILNARTIAGVERLATSDRRIASTVDMWDRDPWLINTPEITINLRSGKQLPHRQSDYLTKITTIAPGGDCPLWHEFLDRITAGDGDLQRYLQRFAGYSLTGSTEEHIVFFCHGTGANGKSVFINTIAGILGDYHRTAPIETFVASSVDRHPTELAGLRSARLVSAVETEEGRYWAESRLKTLTGGDKIAARLMRQDFFEFIPQFKLVIIGNHKPGLRSVDEAVRRRFHLVPFTVTIPPDERDPELFKKLMAEWAGILAWMVDGCLAWQTEGLNPPRAVRDATDAYLLSEDIIVEWIETCCERDPNAWERTTVLFESWRSWAASAGEPGGNLKTFCERLERHFSPKRYAYGRGFIGLRLKGAEAGGPIDAV